MWTNRIYDKTYCIQLGNYRGLLGRITINSLNEQLRNVCRILRVNVRSWYLVFSFITSSAMNRTLNVILSKLVFSFQPLNTSDILSIVHILGDFSSISFPCNIRHNESYVLRSSNIHEESNNKPPCCHNTSNLRNFALRIYEEVPNNSKNDANNWHLHSYHTIKAYESEN